MVRKFHDCTSFKKMEAYIPTSEVLNSMIV